MKMKLPNYFLLITLFLTTLGLPLAAHIETSENIYFNPSDFSMEYVNSYDTGIRNVAAVETLAFSPTNSMLYSINGVKRNLDLLYMTNKGLILLTSVDIGNMFQFSDFEYGDISSVAVDTQGRFIVVSVQNKDYTAPGKALFLDLHGRYLASADVGIQPDMIIVSAKGDKVMVACEGEPRAGYLYGTDPLGSVSIISVPKRIREISNRNVIDITFENVLVDDLVVIREGSTPAEDLEPEFITISEITDYAYVGLQENNAIARINLNTNTVDWVKGLGFKDFSLSGMDPSAKDGVNIRKVPVLGVYMPDSIQLISLGGKEYLVTANEGDSRNWGEYTNEVPVADISSKVQLNANLYEGFTQDELDQMVAKGLLTDTNQLAGLKVHNRLGLNSSGQYEALYSFGARSLSIFDAETLELIYDSGSLIEDMVAQKYTPFFNTTDNFIAPDIQSISRGPEPETVVVGIINDRSYAFLGLEKTGGIIAFDIEDPVNTHYVNEINSRDFSGDIKGDSGIEGMVFVSADDNPFGSEPLIFTGNEVSGTASMFRIRPLRYTNWRDQDLE